VLGIPRPAAAAVGDEQKVADGVMLRTLGEGKSHIPGFPKVQLRELTFQPGAVLPMLTMSNTMVCHMTEGELLIDQEMEKFTAKKGTIWTCVEGGKEAATNTGSTVAIMSISDLLKA
jgi:quercetin dioxygenase-like cupin family protein